MATVFIDPAACAAPAGHYSHGALTTAASRWLHVSGQVGIAAGGSVGQGIEAQSEIVWQNVLAVLHAAQMGLENVVKVTAYLTRPEDFAAYAKARNRVLGHFKPASTVIVVQALARPEWLVEVEVIAAA